MIVSSDLRIRRFTPMAERFLNLIATDVGRSIGHIKPNIECPDLEQLITLAIDTVTLQEREVRDRQGNWYSLRIRPYKNVENRIDGAVLALFDIQTAKTQAGELRAARGHADAFFGTMPIPLVVLDEELRIRDANEAFCQTFGYEIDAIRGRPFFELGKGVWDAPELRRQFEAVGDGSRVASVEIARRFPRVGQRTMLASVRRLDGGGDHAGTIMLMLVDSEPGS